MLLHPDRYSPTAILRKNGVVVHDSEGSEGATSSAQLVRALQAKGDRPSPSKPPPAVYGAGYHAVACEDGTYLEVADATAGPYHAPPMNPVAWAICMPGRAAQTREQWLDFASRPYIRAVARYIVDKNRADGKSWPLVRRSSAELVALQAKDAGHPFGYCAHADVSAAYHQTDHTDPGSSFPWDVLAADIALFAGPPRTDTDTPTTPEDPDMPRQIAIAHDAAVFNVDGLVATWTPSPSVQAAAVADGLISAEIHTVSRLSLGILELHGPLPDYTSVDPVIFPGRTTAGDFARHVP